MMHYYPDLAGSTKTQNPESGIRNPETESRKQNAETESVKMKKSKVAWTTMIDMYYNNIIISHIMQTL